jgi:hypothetical protein
MSIIIFIILFLLIGLAGFLYFYKKNQEKKKNDLLIKTTIGEVRYFRENKKDNLLYEIIPELEPFVLNDIIFEARIVRKIKTSFILKDFK